MKNRIKKRSFLFALFLLMGAPYVLHAAKSVSQPGLQSQKDHTLELTRSKRKILIHGYCRAYNIPTDLFLFVTYFVHDNPLQYKNKTLPNDLSGQDLSGFDFTDCAFIYTNLTYTDLTNVILTNTICDYQKAFLDNIKKNKIKGGDWYQNNLPNDLKTIAKVYPKLNNDTHKAKLLHIACGLSRLPFYEYTEFDIKVAYWSSELLKIKQALGDLHAHQLLCSLVSNLNFESNKYCWTTKYLQDNVTIENRASHTNFVQYLKDFNNGLTEYQCNSEDSYGFDCYKANITRNIKGLSETYPHIKEVTLQQEAHAIAQALSKSYQIQQSAFLFHYLLYQHRLIWLKKSVGKGVKNKIYYSFSSATLPSMSWRRREK